MLSVKVRKGTLVEVEFGYIHSVKKENGDTKSNKRYPDQAKHGEMHKRRLAIVIKAHSGRVQVIPVTSRTPSGKDHATSFELSQESVSRLVDYNDPSKHSFALCGMIQTVSPARILPPKSFDRHRHHVKRNSNYPHKLSTPDMKLLEAALASAVGMGDYIQTRSERNTLKARQASLDADVQNLLINKSFLEGEVHRLTSELRSYRACKGVLLAMYEQLHPARTPEELGQYLQEEVEAFMDLERAL